MDNSSEIANPARKTYACNICDRTFIRLHRLQSHIRTHNKRKIDNNANSESLRSPHLKCPKSIKIAPSADVSKFIQNAIAHKKKIAIFTSPVGEDLQQKATENNKDLQQKATENKKKDDETILSLAEGSTSVQDSIQHLKQQKSCTTVLPVNIYPISHQNPTIGKRNDIFKITATPPVTNSSQNPQSDVEKSTSTSINNGEPNTEYITINTEILSEETVDDSHDKISSPPVVNSTPFHIPPHHISNFWKEIVVKTEFSEEVVETADEANSESTTTPRKKRVTYHCDVCQMPFTNKCHLGRHTLTHTKQKPYVCKVCYRGFTQIGNLNVHYRTHLSQKKTTDPNRKDSGSKLPIVNVTPAEYPKFRLMLKQKLNYECETCGKQFSNKCYLERHSFTHTKEKPYVCTLCFKGFAQVGNLNVHYLTHQDQKDFLCHVCDKAFTLMSSLKAHLLTHMEQKPFQCEVCGKGFSNKCFLKRHSLTHTDTKPYVCSVCGKGFVQVGNLNVHLLTHTNKKDYQCDVCNKCFSRRLYLEKHYKQHIIENNAVS